MPLDMIDDRGERRMANQLVLSPRGLEHIKEYEGFRSEAYDDLNPGRTIRGPQDVEGTLTIGYGHTGHAARIGNRIDQGEAERLLIGEVMGFENDVKRLVKVPLTQGEYDAIVGFTYNAGAENLRRSTLLRKLNAGDHDGAAMEFERWVYSKGQRLRGLVLRRMAEKSMFLGLARHALVDIPDMAARGEEMLLIGSRATPDAIEGAGVMKPKLKSRTGWLSGLGLGGMGFGGLSYAVDGIARIDPKVLALIACLIFAAIMLNRYLEWKAGEH